MTKDEKIEVLRKALKRARVYVAAVCEDAEQHVAQRTLRQINAALDATKD